MSGVPDAAIAACPDYEPETCRTALQQVLAPFGGLAWVKPGMRIAVKANLVSAMKPERAATTHPMLLRVLTEELVRRGASVVVGDSPGGTYAAGHLNAVYRACGLAAVEGGGRHAQPELCPAGGRPAGRARGKAHYLHGLSG